MPFDFKKEYKALYGARTVPEILSVPQANYIVVRGTGDPNEDGGAYQRSIGQLYAVAYTLKMSRKAGHHIEGFFEYVVPPLEGFWWQEGADDVDFTRKATFCWISALRLPDFVREQDIAWAVETAGKRKKIDCSLVELFSLEEGLCVQMLHIGPFDGEETTVAVMDDHLSKNGYCNDLSTTRLHHEIYLSDGRKTPPEKRKTIIRHPIRKL